MLFQCNINIKLEHNNEENASINEYIKMEANML